MLLNYTLQICHLVINLIQETFYLTFILMTCGEEVWELNSVRDSLSSYY